MPSAERFTADKTVDVYVKRARWPAVFGNILQLLDRATSRTVITPGIGRVFTSKRYISRLAETFDEFKFRYPARNLGVDHRFHPTARAVDLQPEEELEGTDR